MKILSGIVTIICFLSAMLVRAQEYKAIQPNANYFVREIYGNEILGIHIDSINIQGEDLIYFTFRQPQYLDEECWDIHGHSWLGDSIIEKPDGSFLFVFHDQPGNTDEVFRIETKTVTGDSWTFYTYQNSGNYILATLDTIEYLNFIGIQDSVKIISLSLRNPSGQLIPDPVNDQTIHLSKSNGLIRLPQFGLFRGFPRFFTIVGRTNPDTGMVIPSFSDIYDFSVGDEFHTVFSEFSYQYDRITISTIRRVTGKEVYPTPDSVKYYFQECKSIHKHYMFNDSTYVSNTSDEVAEVFYRYNIDTAGLSSFPLETITNELFNPPHTYSSRMYSFNNRVEKKIDDPSTGLWYNEGCWHPAIYDICPIPFSYINGLGGPYFDCFDFVTYYIFNRLVYYHKAETSETWGYPISCDSILQVGIEEIPILNSSLTFYPIPASDGLNILLPDRTNFPGILYIYDGVGRLCQKIHIMSRLQFLNLTNNTGGLYSCVYQPRQGLPLGGKFLLK